MLMEKPEEFRLEKTRRVKLWETLEETKEK